MMARHLIILLAALLLFACDGKRYMHEASFQRSIPEKEAVMTEGILSFIEEVEAEGIDMHSLMILRHGKVITEAYWHPYKASTRHIMHSVSKTFASTAIGFAVQERLLSVDDKLVDIFPDQLPAEVSPFLAELSVKHLLTMSVGQNPAPEFYLSDENWVRSFLATPIVDKPGTVFTYNSYATYMLSAIIQKLAGQSMFDYLKPRLFEPLQIKNAVWETGAQNMSAGGWGMRIRTEDMAKLGQFYLQKGWWNGKQILRKEWIREATMPKIFQRDSLSYDEQMYDNWVQGYGYQIWMCINNAYRADGANGQFIIVMPDEDAVVIITENSSKTNVVLNMVFKHLQPAMQKIIYSPKTELKEQMSTAINALAAPLPFLTAEGVDTLRSQSMAFACDSNALGLERIAFSFDAEGHCRYSMTVHGQDFDFSCGLDAWREGSTARLSPYFLSPRRNPDGLAPFAVAGYFSQTAPGELCLRLLYTEDYQEETFLCRLSGESLACEYSNSFRRNDPPIEIRGHRLMQ
ncbi:MAG: beta-lactamase family protein [Tannerellaceae bacterium]|jgi:CubicO group peptidase (beta-lactamase class C family)|nr:beta-lactamase family protein [Tannerellaceae bacterium]